MPPTPPTPPRSAFTFRFPFPGCPSPAWPSPPPIESTNTAEEPASETLSADNLRYANMGRKRTRRPRPPPIIIPINPLPDCSGYRNTSSNLTTRPPSGLMTPPLTPPSKSTTATEAIRTIPSPSTNEEPKGWPSPAFEPLAPGTIDRKSRFFPKCEPEELAATLHKATHHMFLDFATMSISRAPPSPSSEPAVEEVHLDDSHAENLTTTPFTSFSEDKHSPSPYTCIDSDAMDTESDW